MINSSARSKVKLMDPLSVAVARATIAMANAASIQTAACVLTAVLALAATVIYWLQCRASHKQIDAQTYLQVTSLLSLDRELRTDIQRLRQLKTENVWTEDHVHTAERVCAAFNVAGVLANEGYMPKKLFIDQYGDAIVRTADLIADLRNRLTRYKAFWKLADEVRAKP
jgi:hypothetical protein